MRHIGRTPRSSDVISENRRPSPAMLLIAPDSFKGTEHARAVAAAIDAGWRDVRPHATTVQTPLSDGGEGFLDVLCEPLQAGRRETPVHDPCGRSCRAAWGYAPVQRVAIVEFASASGLTLVPPAERTPRRLTSRGTGELIRAALDAGAREVLVGLGGSATVDGGIGLLQGLGATLRDGAGRTIDEPVTPKEVDRVVAIDPPRLPTGTVIRVACDVENPLLGPNGAAAVFGPQKGAARDDVVWLEARLRHLTEVIGEAGVHAGDGAAGGAGYALRTVAGARLERGADVVLDAIDFDARLEDATLVITGEGRVDGQSLMGKACVAAALRAARRGVPTWLLAGEIAPGVREDPRFDLFVEMISVAATCGAERAISEPAAAIRETAGRLAARHRA